MTTYTDERLEAMAEALEAWFSGDIALSKIEEATNGIVKRTALAKELDRLTCHHPHCNEHHPCRAAKRRNGGVMCCTALTNTEFNGYACPFFKTEEEYNEEFWQSYTAEKPFLSNNRIRKYLRFNFNFKKGDGDND